MPIKHTDFIIKGMHRDLSESVFNPEFAYENMNIRITTDKNSSSEHSGDMYALTNEKGNKYKSIVGLDMTGHNSPSSEGNMLGIPVGQCLINNQWVVFMTDRPPEIFIEGEEKEIEDFPIEETTINEIKIGTLDRIYRLWMNEEKLCGELLYEGHLNFDYAYPLETIGFYENEDIQKVYWTDGLNQPRLINILANETQKSKWNDTYFDFVPSINLLGTEVKIKSLETGGMFPAGKVQYYFTYSRLFGQESNIFIQSNLQDIIFNNRGCSPEEKTNQSFEITLTGLDYDNFDFVNIYSVIRTSLDNVPTCKLVAKVELKSDTLVYVDTNLTGEIIEPQSLFYKGGEAITAYTFENKDNTLFLGNYSLQRPILNKEIRNNLLRYASNTNDERHLITDDSGNFKFVTGVDVLGNDLSNWLEKDRVFNYIDTNNDYDIIGKQSDKYLLDTLRFKANFLNCDISQVDNGEEIIFNKLDDLNTFRYKNIYRLGIQFQHYTGKWSEVIWLGDYQNNKKINSIGAYKTPVVGYMKLNSSLNSTIQTLIDFGYRRARPVIVYPNESQRVVLAQGLLCNTLHSNLQPEKYYPDYFLRDKKSDDYENIHPTRFVAYSETPFMNDYCHYVDNYHLPISEEGSNYRDTDMKTYLGYYYPALFRAEYKAALNSNYVNLYQSNEMLNFYSPDIEFNDSLKILNFKNKTFKLYGDSSHALECKKVENQITTSSISKAKIGNYKERSNYYLSSTYTWAALDSSSFFSKLTQHFDNSSMTYPRGFGYDSNDNYDETGYLYHTYKDATDKKYYIGGSSFPRRKLGEPTYRNMMWNSHYVGGYIWEDSITNYRKVNNETLQMEVPTRAACFVQNFYRFLFPVHVWQHTGSVCYDKNDNTSSVLKTNKTLHYFRIKSQSNITSEWDSEITPEDIKISYDGVLDKLELNNTKSSEDEKYYNLHTTWVNTSLLYKGGYFAAVQQNGDGKDINLESFVTSEYRTENYENDGPSNIYGLNLLTDVSQQPSANYDLSDNDINDFFEWKDVNLKLANYNESFVTNVKYKTVTCLTAAFNFGYITQEDNLYTLHKKYERDEYQSNIYHGLRFADIIQKVDYSTLFGGYSDDDLQANSFLQCGRTVDICTKEFDSELDRYEYYPKNNIELIWDKGDTYIQTYSLLKTYPYTLEDENSVTEVGDFTVETYINLKGRYDSWKGNPTFSTTPANWNLINRIYEQKDNFMVYHGLNLSKNSVSKFPNSFTWTLTKWAGDEQDKWTTITLASTMDVDGDKGRITKIIKLQDNLLCFQPKQINQILYNEREQIATGSGVPIELSNSGKVNGVRPLSILAGCNNKWSICKTEKGLYWIDDVNKQILNFAGQINNLSDSLGFHSWINDKSTLEIWNPLEFNNFVTYFDPYNESVMFFNKDNMLSYNEQLNCFDSFFSYGYVPYYISFNNTEFILSDKDSAGVDSYKVWEQHKGNYNYFFVHDNCVYENGELKLKGRFDINNEATYYGYEPYWTTILVNPDMPYDKVFNNLDMKTDMWNKYGDLLEETFSHIEVWNEFQHNKSYLVRQLDVPKLHYPAQHSILKKKFRSWYVNIPRDTKQSNPRLRYFNRDRMRNMWIYLKLSKELVINDKLIKYPYINDNKHIIHHIGISYFV